MAEQGATAVESIRPLLERFLDNEATVRDLIARDPTFAALCREYGQTAEEVQQLRQERAHIERELQHLRQRRDHIEGELERLPQWHEQLEEGLLTRIEGYTPV